MGLRINQKTIERQLCTKDLNIIIVNIFLYQTGENSVGGGH